MTKPVTSFKQAKIRSYAHWTIEDWSKIQRLAAEKQVPNHWVILAAAKFATSQGTELEFKNRLDDLIMQVRLEMGLEAAQKPTSIRNAICRFCKHIVMGGAKDLDYHEVTCTKRPLEVIAR